MGFGFNVPSYADRARAGMQGAARTYAMMRPDVNTTVKKDPSLGNAVGKGVGGAYLGYELGQTLGIGAAEAATTAATAGTTAATAGTTAATAGTTAATAGTTAAEAGAAAAGGLSLGAIAIPLALSGLFFASEFF